MDRWVSEYRAVSATSTGAIATLVI
ncbi:uncharacterized protein G2W53_014379 [Senna tora]|uniref:Uncharacterized protein n=1 Tax=Senna tora TaxID=362788 RepID=A0A835C2H4_9FABA|nr:uncharacterized protein G2W53_014379 [Senna tora]